MEKNELGRNYNGGPADWKGILISPALSSRLAFGDETPSGGKCRGY